LRIDKLNEFAYSVKSKLGGNPNKI